MVADALLSSIRFCVALSYYILYNMSHVTYVIHLYFIPFTLSSAGHAAASLRALKGGPAWSCENRNADANDGDGTFPLCNLNGGKNTDGTVADEGDTCMPCCECNCGGPNDKEKCMKLLPNNSIEPPRVCEGYGDKFVSLTLFRTCAAQCADFCLNP